MSWPRYRGGGTNTPGVGVSLHLLWRVYIVYEKGKCKYPLTSDRFTALLQQTAAEWSKAGLPKLLQMQMQIGFSVDM